MLKLIRRLVCGLIGHNATEIDRVYIGDTLTVFFLCHRCLCDYSATRKERREGVVRPELIQGTLDERAEPPDPPKSVCNRLQPLSHSVENKTQKSQSTVETRGRKPGEDISGQLSTWLSVRNRRVTDVANSTGMQRSDISSYKTGNKRTGLPTIERLADYFGVSVEEFLAGPNGEFSGGNGDSPEAVNKAISASGEHIKREVKTRQRERAADNDGKGYFVGGILARWMDERGIGYDDIRHKIGISFERLNDIIDDKEPVNYASLMEIAGVFGVSGKQFLDGPETEKMTGTDGPETDDSWNTNVGIEIREKQ